MSSKATSVIDDVQSLARYLSSDRDPNLFDEVLRMTLLWLLGALSTLDIATTLSHARMRLTLPLMIELMPGTDPPPSLSPPYSAGKADGD